MTKEEWDLILALVGVGMNECPWGWDKDTKWPDEREQIEQAVQKFIEFVKAEKDSI